MKKKIVLLLTMLMILAIPVTSFANDTEITKAQFIKDVLEAGDIKVEEVSESDLAGTVDTQYIPYVEAAYNKDIISEDEKLNTDKLITKEEAVIILVKAFGERIKLKNITQEMIDKEMRFSDNTSINSLAKPYITYALKNNMIKKNKRSFYPLMVLTEETSKAMIKQAKSAQEKYFTREGLSAGDMLVKADKNIRELKTYKADGNLKMNMKMNIEGLPTDDEVGQELLNQGINMDMNLTLGMQVENPDKAYVKETIKANVDSPEAAGMLDTENVVEIFMDKEVMYQKMALTGDKWIKNDMSSVYNQIQELQGSNPQNMSQLSDAQLEFFKDYAWYSDDEEINGKEYYVVNANIDKKTYKKFFDEYAKKIMEAAFDQQKEVNPLNEESADSPEMVKALMNQIIEKMDIEINYKFYINKKTMNYDKMWMSQNVYMNMNELINMMAEMSEEENTDLSNVKAEMVTHLEGEFNYTDFDGEVNFPIIKANDIFQLGDTMIPQN